MWKPIKADCSSEFRAVHHSNERDLADIRYLVIHAAESSSAKSTAVYFTEESSGGSTQIVIGDVWCYRTLPDNLIPWAAPPLNAIGWHAEFAGYTAWPRWRWLAHRVMLYRGAYKFAYHAKKFGIPIVFVTSEDLGTGRISKGVTTHREISNAWHKSTHTDPGDGFPLDYFLGLATRYRERM